MTVWINLCVVWHSSVFALHVVLLNITALYKTKVLGIVYYIFLIDKIRGVGCEFVFDISFEKEIRNGVIFQFINSPTQFRSQMVNDIIVTNIFLENQRFFFIYFHFCKTYHVKSLKFEYDPDSDAFASTSPISLDRSIIFVLVRIRALPS